MATTTPIREIINTTNTITASQKLIGRTIISPYLAATHQWKLIAIILGSVAAVFLVAFIICLVRSSYKARAIKQKETSQEAHDLELGLCQSHQSTLAEPQQDVNLSAEPVQSDANNITTSNKNHGRHYWRSSSLIQAVRKFFAGSWRRTAS
ncbi:hypothetical protein F4678DRAFT_459837 [Xylaria arbuscula]|nr:hypothetical protein F4678DRAFT_459837 [Xylaria arbuscula]